MYITMTVNMIMRFITMSMLTIRIGSICADKKQIDCENENSLLLQWKMSLMKIKMHVI